MDFLLITGMSGAGKSLALNFFEDRGYFCVDNLPPALITKFAKLCLHSDMNKIAVVSDIRGREFFEALYSQLSNLEEMNINHEILYLEASNETLIRRYKETRRKHPLDEEGRMIEAIKKERKLMEEFRGKSTNIIDTSRLSVKEFNNELESIYSLQKGGEKKISISVVSFGFKYGMPKDSDLVFDVRFLPNPHYVNHLKDKTGKDKEVQDYIFKWPVANRFYNKLFDFIEFLIPEYIKEGKSHLSIAIGCTGGQHRSVTTALRLGEFIKNKDYRVVIKHRDIDKKRDESSQLREE